MLHKQKMVELKVPDLYSHDQIIGEAGKQVLMKSTGVEVAWNSLAYGSLGLIINGAPMHSHSCHGLDKKPYGQPPDCELVLILTEFGQFRKSELPSGYPVHLSQVSGYQILKSEKYIEKCLQDLAQTISKYDL